MSKKFSAQRKRAFLTYLAQSGNQTLSAERAKVSRSWVQLHRSTDAEFDAACRAAIAGAGERIRGIPDQVRDDGKCSGTPVGWAQFDGAELVVESVVAGTGGSGGGKRVQVRRARLKQWTPRVEQRFLSVLAATCNVKLACREVGMWPPSAYNHRRRWPAFARAWDEAVEMGYLRLEAALVEAGCNMTPGRSTLRTDRAEPCDPLEVELDLSIRGMGVHDAMQLLHMHKHQVRGIGRRPGLPQRRATDAEVRQALARSLRAFGVRLAEEDLEGERE